MLGDAIRGALPRLRAQAESMMFDTCEVREIVGEDTGPDGRVVTVYGDPIYSGRCRVSGDRPYEQTPEAGGQEFNVRRFILSLPATSGPYREGMQVLVLTSEFQPSLIGSMFRIAGADERTAQTAQRMFIEAVS